MLLRGMKLILQATACMFVITGSANALTIINAESDTTSGVTALSEGTDYYGGNLHGPGSFTDYFNFSLASAPLGTITVSAPAILGTIANLQLVWLNAALGSISSVLTVTDVLGVATATNTLSFALLSPGDYHLQVTGTALANGGTYNVAISTTPLPPALLLFGSALAGLGFLGRRSRPTTPTPLA